MPETDHDRYLSLIRTFYASKLSDENLTELTRLHAANMERVNLITTADREAKT